MLIDSEDFYFYYTLFIVKIYKKYGDTEKKLFINIRDAGTVSVHIYHDIDTTCFGASFIYLSVRCVNSHYTC